MVTGGIEPRIASALVYGGLVPRAGSRANQKLLCARGLSNAMATHLLPDVESFSEGKPLVCFGLVGTKQSF